MNLLSTVLNNGDLETGVCFQGKATVAVETGMYKTRCEY